MLCSRVKNLLSAYCDSELTGVDMLHIRQHLRSCESCRVEHAGIRQMKALIGALPGADPRSAFDPERVWTAPSPQPRWMRLLTHYTTQWATEYAAAIRQRLLQPVSLPGARVWQTFTQAVSPLSPAIARFAGQAALCGVVAGVVLCVGLLGQPQKPDAVSAQVPETVAMDETGPAPVGFQASVPVRLPGVALPASFPTVGPGPSGGPGVGADVVFPGSSLLEDDDVREVSLFGRSAPSSWPLGPALRRVDYSRAYSPADASPFRPAYTGTGIVSPFAPDTTVPGW